MRLAGNHCGMALVVPSIGVRMEGPAYPASLRTTANIPASTIGGDEPRPRRTFGVGA